MAGAQAVRYGQVAGARDEYSYLLEWTTAARRLRPALVRLSPAYSVPRPCPSRYFIPVYSVVSTIK